jgi:2',3'-cyclic-nucleotide 2'-phosphodiesterase (5'-nucleotidase family)
VTPSRVAAALLPAILVSIAALHPVLHAQKEESGAPRAGAAVTFLQINDVYSTVPIDGAGGLARVATLKKRLKDQGRTPFMVLAGDFLSPSIASSVFKGAQMVAALNAAGLDLATLGNHELDFGDDELIERMKEANWQWVVSNVVDRRTHKPIGGAAPYVIKKFGNLNVGFIGLCLVTGEISRDKLTHTDLIDPFAAAARYLPMLRSAGAQLIVAVTHLPFSDDRRLVERFPEIDLVIGGHEHFPITATVGHALISKAGSDARWVARLDVTKRPGRPPDRFYELLPITEELPDEPNTANVIAEYEAKLAVELDAVVGESRVPLDAQSIHLRTAEQPIGNLFADMLRANVDADIAMVNSGSIRGDRVYPAGPLKRRTLLAMHPFGNVVCKVELTGARLLQVLNAGVSRLPAAAGQFPQVSGLTLTVDVNARPGNRVRDVKVNGEPLDPAKSYSIAIPDFVLKGGDGYSMFAGLPVLVSPEAGDLIVSALEEYVSGHTPIEPKVEGRITLVR